MSKDLDTLISVVETWNVQKQTGRKFTGADMYRFAETMNDRARHLISIMGRDYPEFYTGLFELAQHACTLTTPDAKVFVDGIDRTQL